MSLSLIVGPPNSGRTGAVLDGFRAGLNRDPVLVVPTLDDSDRFERELCAGLGGVIGGRVGTFAQLFEQVLTAVGRSSPPVLTPVQRVRVAREGAARAELVLLARSRERRGFAPAVAALISELQGVGLEPGDFAERAATAGDYERELARLFEGYAAVREELGYGDSHTLARAAIAGLRASGEAWRGRPVFLYGFDDLTGEQLDLVAELARATHVTVALTFEDRDALAARARLHEQLRELGVTEVSARESDPGNTPNPLLFELERRFMEERGERLDPAQGLTMLEAAGELAEVEAIGEAVAHLLSDGAAAEQIAIVLREPATQGALYRRVLGEMGIPVSVEARLPLGRTATGYGLISLLRAALEGGDSSELLAYLRTPGLGRPGSVDWLERDLRRGRVRDCNAALERWRERVKAGLDLREVGQLREAGSGPRLLEACAYQARRIAELAMRDHRSELPGEDRALELRAGAAAERALGELADLGLPATPAEAIEAIEMAEVPLWRGPATGRVRVLSPYRVRAGRMDHLFVASLQEGEFPRRHRPAPLLDDDRRAELGLPERADDAEEERYLFSVCLSRPRRSLHLSWRSSDDEGRALPRSPFVDEIRELFDARGDSLLVRRELDQVVPRPQDASAPGPLARSLADLGPEVWPSALASLELAGPVRARCETALREAEGKLPPERVLPGPLSVPSVLADLADRSVFSPSGLETYATCPYMWFVRRELEPQRLDPEEDSQAIGSIVHAILEGLYREGAAGELRPTVDALDSWRRRGWELAQGAAEERGMDSGDPDCASQIRRSVGLALAFLEDEAKAGMILVPSPELAEASFGLPDADKDPLELEGFAVHGKIDRVDLTPDGAPVRAALIQDYKSAREVTKSPAKLREEGKLQLQLYMRAIRDLWGLELIGGVYRPLGGTGDRRAQGLLRDEMGEQLKGLAIRPGDMLKGEAFDEALDDAAAHAGEIVGAIRAGKVRRDPIGGSCPTWCTLQPICRRERGGEDEPEDEANGGSPE
jgi:ATP-dependent helicase/DNAse subunit B